MRLSEWIALGCFAYFAFEGLRWFLRKNEKWFCPLKPRLGENFDYKKGNGNKEHKKNDLDWYGDFWA